MQGSRGRLLLLLYWLVIVSIAVVSAEQDETAAAEKSRLEDVPNDNSDHWAQKEGNNDEEVGDGAESESQGQDIETDVEGNLSSNSSAVENTASPGGNANVSEEQGSSKPSGRTLSSSPRLRVKVNCWDYRKIEEYRKAEEEASAKVAPIVPDEGDKSNGTEAQEQSESGGSTKIEGEDGTVFEPAEEGGATPIPVPVEEKNGEETETGSSDIEREGEENAEADPAVYQDFYSNRTVEIVNMTHLMGDILIQNTSIRGKAVPGNCTLVMFYTTWCPFSAKAAPHYNALPRAYPPLTVVAIDVQKYKTVNTFFGILGVPTVALFHNGRLIAKFNESQFTLNKFAEFVEYFTDLKAEEKLNVTSKDFEGPIPSAPNRGRDWMLLVAWIFLIGCFAHYITKCTIWWRFVEFVRTTWREAEQQVQQPQHEHMD